MSRKIAKYPTIDSIEIPQATREAWRQTLATLSQTMEVSASLIMRAHELRIEVFEKSPNPENIYETGEMSNLDTGLYCEWVMNHNRMLNVPNALLDSDWVNNPDIKLGMINYLGYPLFWPNGEIFGTICVLDQKERHYGQALEELLNQFRLIVQNQLADIYHQNRLEKTIAELLETQAHLSQQAGLAAIGEVTVNIAHQWRQPLNNLKLLLHSIKESPPERSGEVQEMLEQSQNLVQQLSEIISNFSNFFSSSQEMRSFSINEKIQATLSIIYPTLESEGIKLVVEMFEGLTAQGLPQEFGHVILNIIKNSCESFEQKEVKEGLIRIRSHQLDTREAEITILDNAGGIEIEPIEKIFEPYVTSKFKAQGTGLGLYISKIFIEQHMGGSLSVQNLSEGALFKIRLPQGELN